MADISKEIAAIEAASTGNEVRQSIIAAFLELNSDLSDAETLNGQLPSYYATQRDINEINEMLGRIEATIDQINGAVV